MNDNSQKLMILDGNSIINRAYYGIRMLNAPDGTPTNGVYGFLTILQRLLDEERPEALCVAFDLKSPTFRHEKYELYKAQRKAMPEELAIQMPLMKEMLDALGVTRLELAGYEADDIIGAVSRLCEKSGWDCVIVTGDKDSFQLITKRVTVKHVKTRLGQTETVDYTPERFREEYGFEPIKMIDLKALMGDASDNIPGVPGVGEKTALALIRGHGSLGGVYSELDAADIKPGVRKKLEEGRESAKLSYDLATIDTSAPVELDPAAARWELRPSGELYQLCLRLGFTKFIQKWALRPDADSPAAPEVFECECTSSTVENADELRSALAELGEATVYFWCASDLSRLAFLHGGRAFLMSRESYSGDWDEALRLLFAPGVKKAGHNVKDIQRVLLDSGVPAEGWVFDSALAAYLLDATASGYELEKLAPKYLGFELGRAGEDEDGQMTLLTDDLKLITEYLQKASTIEALEEVFTEKLRELGMEELFRDIELPLCAALAEMERAGFLVDGEALAAFGESLSGDISRLQRDIWALAGEEFNINSPQQLGNLLFEKLMLPSGKKTKTGWSTNAETLEKLRGKSPIIQEVLDYRELTKLKSTYADGLVKVIAPDGRIHTSFQMTVTATGRLSSTEPNLQNIPIRRELGSGIRKMFVAAPGKLLVDADYSQIELRLLAHISGDESMIAAFRSGEDIHAVTASQVFGLPLEAVTPQLRSRAKAVNFGIVYGISAFSLAQDIGVYQSEAKEYIDSYLTHFAGVREYMERTIAQAKRDGYVSTLFGRRRYLPELKSSNFNQRSFGERVARNMPIQGTAADVIKLAMVNVRRRLRAEGLEARLILQVHDELIVECPEAEAPAVAALLEYEMEHAVDYSVPLIAQAKTGRSWHDAH